MKAALRERARELGFDDCRFTSAAAPESSAHFELWLREGRHGEMQYLARNAAKRVNPQQVLPGARSIVCLATNYHSGQGAVPQPGHGAVARYAGYTDYHETLGARLKELSDFINQAGGPGTRSLWYVDTGPLLERDLAQRAGIGFVGKHTGLISRGFGNWTLLSEILTTVEIEPDAAEHNRCGSCTRCLAACPTGAIRAPFQLDARLCISYLTIELKGSIPEPLRPAIGNRLFGCDDCLAVCPWNRFAKEAALMKNYARPDLATPDLLSLLRLDEARFKQRFQGTPLARSRRRGLLRNA
jgi:epoxyqueuosine reductase